MTTSLDPIELKVISEQVAEALKPIIQACCQGNKGKPEHDEIMDVDELSKYLKVPVRWIYAQTHLNCIPYFKAGNFLRFRKSLIDKHFSRCSVPAASSVRLPGRPLD
jgi:excisionase family DNA binding protein